jgi:hypothetical protein
MEVSFNLRPMAAVNSASAVQPAQRGAKADEPVLLENAHSLTNALAQSPAARDGVVRRAAELVGDPTYPPPETIRQISYLLAIQLQSEE